jgi:hypothetical protein
MRRVPKLSFGQGQLMLWILAGSLTAFGVMFLFFRVSGVALTATPRKAPHISWMPTARQDPLSPQDPRYVMADVFDPSLMSLPNAHGFSSGAWHQTIEAAQRNLGWNQQPAFLSPAPPSEPRSLLEPTPLDAAVLSAAEKTEPISEEPSDGDATAPLVSVNQSVFRVLGPLERRVVVNAPALPEINNPTPLRPTQIRVGVGADGLVLYALLDRSSGDDGVDAQALALAHRIRFEAEQDSSPVSLAWGVLRFLWATQPPPATTNVESAAAQR